MKMLIIFVFLLCMAGCSTVPLQEPNKQIATTTKVIENCAIGIKHEALEIEREVPEPVLAKIENNLENIVNYADIIVDDIEIIDSYNVESNKQIEKLISERDEAIIAKDSAIQKMLRWLITLSIIGSGVFGVLFFLHGSKYGLTGASICGAILLISLFVTTYLTYLIIAGAILFSILTGLLVYQVVIRGKGIREIVESVEQVKKALPEDVDAIKTTLATKQTKTTTDMVHNIKNKLL